MQDAHQHDPSHRSSHTRKMIIRWSSIVLLSVIGIAVAVGQFRAHTFRYIGSYSTQSLMVWAMHDGFLSIQNEEKSISDARKPCVLLFRDWHGRNRWKIALPMITQPATAVSVQTPFFRRAFGVSPDGHFIAAAIVDPSRPIQQRILTVIWKDEKKVGQVSLPEMGRLPRWINVLSDGQALLYGVQEREINLALIRNGRLLATGRYISHLGITREDIPFIQFYIAPDLSSLGIMVPQNMKTKPNFEYATLAITGTRITPTFRWRALGMSSPQFFTKGLVVDKDSAMYRVTGQIAKPGRWLLIPASTESLWVEQRDDTHARVYMPDNGDAWQLPAPNMKDYPSFPTLINITPDGRYIIQPRITERILNGRVVLILNGLTRFRSLKNNITNWRQQEFLYFELYERPGQLRTRIPCEVINRATSNGRYAYRGNIFEFFAPYLSPDGRHCVLATLRLKPTGEAHTQLLVFNR